MGEAEVEEGEPELLRVEFLHTRTPVEGCDLLPYVVMRMPNGDVKTSDLLDSMTGGSISVQYQWYRCSQRYTCSNGNCRQPAHVQFCALYRIIAEDKELEPDVRKDTFFCSNKCFKESWRRLRGLQVQETARNGNWAGDMSKRLPYQTLDEDRRDECMISAVGFKKNVADPETNPRERREVGWSRSFTPTSDDIGHALQVVCRYAQRLEGGEMKIGPPLTSESEMVLAAPPPPPERALINVFTRTTYACRPRWAPKGGTFRVLTYNCLAEIYANPRQFPWCASWALAWTYRRRNLAREIQNYAADILCLQEIQADHFEDHFQPLMARLGYQGVFKSKTREAMGKKGKIDGCATFWSKERFFMREQHAIEFNTSAYTRGLKDSRALKVLMKGNIGQMTVLDELDGSGCTVIANTHIYWDPDKSEIKVFQVDSFLSEIESLVQRLGSSRTSVVFAGDLNSPPDSAVYELVSTGSLGRGVHDELRDDDFSILNSCRLSHNLQLRSAYASLGREPEFTNYTQNFVGTLDYIWYSQSSLVCVAVLEMPEEKEVLLDRAKGMPNSRWSSDHCALMCEFSRVVPVNK